MKSITKLVVVAMLLVAALVVAPVAAARDITINGTNVFIGEENLDFSGGDFAGTTQLVHYTGEVGKSSTDKTITVTGGVVNELVKGIPTGSYYAIGSQYPDLTYVNVQNPEVTLDIVLNGSRKDSVNGKSVTRDTKLAFKVWSNVDTYETTPPVYLSDNVSIELTLPGGGVVTSFGGQSLKYNADSSTKYMGPVNLDGAEAGTYSAVAKWARSSDFFGKGYDSKPVTFEILTKALAITSNKDSLVRGNSFTVTITGEARTDYQLFVKGANPADLDKNPMIAPGQTAIPDYNVPGENDWNRTVKTNAGGTATIQLNTTKNTDDKTFTIRVEEKAPGDKSDEVKVKVEAGSVTITSSGTGTYYIGEEITFSGTCTESNTIYLYMTGPNFDTNGVNLTRLEAVVSSDGKTFESADVNADDTWSKKWNTAKLAEEGKSIDAGGYTIYAVSGPVNKGKLSDAKYATVSINLKTGFLTATTSGATVAKGDKLIISGTAQGNPDDVYIWIFGKNYYGKPSALDVRSVSVESDGSFEEELDSSATKDLAAGQYFVVVQHPMGADSGDAGSISWSGTTGDISGNYITPVKLTNLQAPNAATALINALDSPNIPDTYVKLTFVIDEPQLFIDPIGTKEAGSKFTITGTTNLAVGNTLVVDVTSAAFQPGAKTEASAFSGTGGSTIVEKGDGANKWSFEVDATDFKPDEYIVTVESIESDKTATALFDMVEATETTPPAGEVTTPPAGEVTTPPADETPAEPTTPPTPGFGALVALAGLGAVAFLVLRRK